MTEMEHFIRRSKWMVSSTEFSDERLAVKSSLKVYLDDGLFVHTDPLITSSWSLHHI